MAVTPPVTTGLSPYAKYAALGITIILALLDYLAVPANQNLSLPVIIGALILVMGLVLHDLEGASSTQAQAAVKSTSGAIDAVSAILIVFIAVIIIVVLFHFF